MNIVFHNSGAGGFQNRFTGTSGNIHISWLGKLSTENGRLQHSTYVAELAQGATNLGSPHSDPLMDGWPDPNSGWPTLNTTRLSRNAVTTTADGSVIVLGAGRRPLTTRNAFFKMPNPYYGGLSAWSPFVRQYNAELRKPLYSSIVRGQWDTLSAQPPSNTELFGVEKLGGGLLVVGKHNGTEGELPVGLVPNWGKASYNSTEAVVGYFEAPEILNEDDGPLGNGGGGACQQTALSMPNDPIQSGTYATTETIISNGKVPAGSEVTFQAGQMISLQAGFTAEAGSVFVARIENCSPNTQMALDSTVVEAPRRDPPIISSSQPLPVSELLVYPNPFREEAIIRYNLSENGPAQLVLLDMLGRSWVLQPKAVRRAGVYEFRLNASGLRACWDFGLLGENLQFFGYARHGNRSLALAK